MFQKGALPGSEASRQTWAAVASVVWVIWSFEGPFGLKTAGLKVTQGLLPPGKKPCAGCDAAVSPALPEGPSAAGTDGGMGVPRAQDVPVAGTCRCLQLRSGSLCRAPRGCRACGARGLRLELAEGLCCLFPVPPAHWGRWDAPGAGVGCAGCRRNPETPSCCRNLLAQAT